MADGRSAGDDGLARVFDERVGAVVASTRPGVQESGEVNAEEGAGGGDEASGRKMSDLAAGGLAENYSTDPGGDTGRQLLDGGVYTHESASMAGLDAGGH